ncbi:MAG: deoxyhypusine synthase family protein, partial [Candidatus Woesearchaeota archaeon]
LSPFLLGSFDVDDNEVKANKLNRIGNIFVSDESYIALEKWHNDFLKDFCLKSRTIVPSEYIAEIGKKLSDKRSVLYWAAKNEVPIFCPGFVDGALGDHFFIFNEKRHADEKLIIDAAADLTKFYKLILEPKRIGAVILGGGIAKHHLIGAAILRDGLDYAIYISTGNEYDGSLSGAKPKEAVSWNKLKSSKNSVAIDAEATLVFPLLAHVWIHGS